MQDYIFKTLRKIIIFINWSSYVLINHPFFLVVYILYRISL